MLKDVTLGQFFPGDTIVHRLDARTKLILVIVYIVGLFQAVGWVSYGAVTLATAACMWLSHISAKNIFKGLKPMLFIIVLTALLNIFYTDGTPIIPGWVITWEGIARAVQMILRSELIHRSPPWHGIFILLYHARQCGGCAGPPIMRCRGADSRARRYTADTYRLAIKR